MDSDAGGDVTTSNDGCTQSRVYTFTTTDDCENSDTETTTVSRTYDISNPDIVDLADYDLEGCNTEWPEFLTTTWTDNCADGGEIQSDNGVDLESNSDGTFEYREYTFTITDSCGNSDTESTIVSRSGFGSNIESINGEKCITENGNFDLFDYLIGDYDTSGVWERADGNDITLNGSFFNPFSLLDEDGNFEEDQLIEYVFIYIIDGACPSETEVIITLNDICIEFPCEISVEDVTTALTPNDDNVNETFDSGLDLGDICTVDVQIFNRWGAKIFEARDYLQFQLRVLHLTLKYPGITIEGHTKIEKACKIICTEGSKMILSNSYISSGTNLVSNHGGELKIYSTQGEGSRFVIDFLLPIAEINNKTEEKTITNTSLDPIIILLVEDDQISRLAINTWLTDKGHRVIIAENGKYAVDYLQENKADVILMDVHMPEMNGIEATKIIKEKGLSQAPIIGMTASVMNDERESYIEAGMDVVVEKPVNFERLMGIVKNKLNK